jgi:HPt (histidine-containing phosphotransfer) domain-containing protein
MTKINAKEPKKKFLCIESAIQLVCDKELAHQMLTMLNESIKNDWLAFEACLDSKQYLNAANILHGIKGTVPIFSDKKTEEVILKVELLLLRPVNESELEKALLELRFRILGFMSEVKMWVKIQNQLTPTPT